MSKESNKLEPGCKTNKPTLDKKTGSWRTFTPIITDKCIGCGQCVNICPEGAIKIIEKAGKKKAVINYDYCKGCLICMNQCPLKAIEKKMEK